VCQRGPTPMSKSDSNRQFQGILRALEYQRDQRVLIPGVVWWVTLEHLKIQWAILKLLLVKGAFFIFYFPNKNVYAS
jgi:hypothetical protein